MTPPQVWCAIPVYNNAATVKDLATRARTQLDHVLVIDDGSTDADLEQLFAPTREGEAPAEPGVSTELQLGGSLALPSKITLLRHPTNRGKGAALLTAMHYAHAHGAHYLITLDADGQHFPEDIPRFLPHLSPDTILLGHRAEITGDMPKSSQFGREFSDFWIHTETGQSVLDSQSGFRAYPLPACLDLSVHSLRYGFEVEILTRALWSGLQVASVPIRVHYPPRSERISSFHPLRDNTRLTAVHSRLIARQLLPIPHKQIQVHRRAAEDAEAKKTDAGEGALRATPPRDTGFQPLPGDPTSREAQVTVPSPRPRVPASPRHSPLPLPHSPTPPLSSHPSCLRAFVVKNPFSSALSAGLTTFFSIVLYPWGFIPVLYLVLRLHLSKLTAFLFLILCLPTSISTLSQRIGHAFLQLNSHPHLERFIGAHFIAFPACFAAAAITYTVARKLYRNPNQ